MLASTSALLACCVVAVLGGGLLARTRRFDLRRVQALAGGLLLGIVALDLVPDLLGDAREAGLPLLVPVAVGLVAAGVSVPVLRRDGGCCGTGSGRVTAAGLAVHGLTEGLVLGVGLDLGGGSGAWWLLTVFALHKAAEGYVIAASAGRARLRWLTLAAVAPAAGALLGRWVEPDGHPLFPLVAAVLIGLLVVVGWRLVRPALDRSAVAVERLLPLAGFAVIAAVIGLQP